MKEQLSVAIIIPVKSFNDKLKKSIEECLKLDYDAFEILVFPDKLSKEFDQFSGKIKVIATGDIGPAEKRDLALKHSNVDIFAFLDDDAYPDPDWLKNAVKHFDNLEIAAVGGPSVTPPESTFASAASGNALASIIVSGPYTYRYIQGKKIMEVDDYPSCNFMVRREVFKKLGGFDSSFYPGEDTKLCLEITRELNKKIIYDPKVLVYHHRRDSIIGHLQQMANYAMHRGNFAKRYPETSRKLAYFVPSLFVAVLFSGAVFSWLIPSLRGFYSVCVAAYFIIVTAFAIAGMFYQRETSLIRKIALIVPVIIYIVDTHICYGIFFLKGLMLKKLKEEQ
ncbi:MAG: glycosyltransferase [Candidatus Omnitrophota bacterium]